MSQSETPATQKDMTTCLETFEKERFCGFPHGEATGKPETRDETRGTPKRAFRARLPPIFTLCSFKIDVFLRVFVGTSKFCNLKIDFSCEAFVNFQHISQNATPAAEFAPCRHLTMRFAQNTRHDTSKVLRLPRLPRKTRQRDVWNLQKWPALQNLP